MEGGYKLWDEVLKTIQSLTSWPLVVLYLSLSAGIDAADTQLLQEPGRVS